MDFSQVSSVFPLTPAPLWRINLTLGITWDSWKGCEDRMESSPTLLTLYPQPLSSSIPKGRCQTKKPALKHYHQLQTLSFFPSIPGSSPRPHIAFSGRCLLSFLWSAHVFVFIILTVLKSQVFYRTSLSLGSSDICSALFMTQQFH